MDVPRNLEYRPVKEKIEVMCIYPSIGLKAGDIGVLLGSFYHIRGKWKGQFLMYHCRFGTRDIGATEDDVQILSSKTIQ